LRLEFLFRALTLIAELRDHRLDVCESAICRIDAPCTLLSRFHVNLHLFTSLLGQLVHIFLNEVFLCAQVSVTLLSVLKLLFKLQVDHFELVDRPLEFLFSFTHVLVLLRQLSQLMSKLGEFVLEFVHGSFMRFTNVLHFLLCLSRLSVYLRIRTF